MTGKQEVKPLTEEDARALTKNICRAVDDLEELILKAFRGKVWEAMGYDNWDDWCEEELPVGYVQMEKESRIRLTMKLSHDGEMSQYAIAAAMKTSQGTVKRDLKEGELSRDDSPLSDTVTGRDGKKHARKKPSQAPELVDRGDDDEQPEPMKQTIKQAVKNKPTAPKAPPAKTANEALPIISSTMTKLSKAVTSTVARKDEFVAEDIEELKRISALASDIQCAIEAALMAEEINTETAETE